MGGTRPLRALQRSPKNGRDSELTRARESAAPYPSTLPRQVGSRSRGASVRGCTPSSPWIPIVRRSIPARDHQSTPYGCTHRSKLMTIYNLVRMSILLASEKRKNPGQPRKAIMPHLDEFDPAVEAEFRRSPDRFGETVRARESGHLGPESGVRCR